MRLTITPSNALVYVDGEPLPIDCSSLPSGINAIQWDDSAQVGWIEWVNDGFGEYRLNSKIDLDLYNRMLASLQTAWHAEKQKRAEAEAETMKQIAKAKAAVTESGMHVVAD